MALDPGTAAVEKDWSKELRELPAVLTKVPDVIRSTVAPLREVSFTPARTIGAVAIVVVGIGVAIAIARA